MTVADLAPLERAFAARFVRRAESGQMAMGAIILENDGPVALIYFAASAFVAALIAASMVPIVVVGVALSEFGNRSAASWTVVAMVLGLIFLSVWFDLRLIQYLKSRRLFRDRTGLA